jgi:hypothetical protein
VNGPSAGSAAGEECDNQYRNGAGIRYGGNACGNNCEIIQGGFCGFDLGSNGNATIYEYVGAQAPPIGACTPSSASTCDASWVCNGTTLQSTA